MTETVKAPHVNFIFIVLYFCFSRMLTLTVRPTPWPGWRRTRSTASVWWPTTSTAQASPLRTSSSARCLTVSDRSYISPKRHLLVHTTVYAVLCSMYWPQTPPGHTGQNRVLAKNTSCFHWCILFFFSHSFLQMVIYVIAIYSNCFYHLSLGPSGLTLFPIV